MIFWFLGGYCVIFCEYWVLLIGTESYKVVVLEVFSWGRNDFFLWLKLSLVRVEDVGKKYSGYYFFCVLFFWLGREEAFLLVDVIVLKVLWENCW